MDESIVNINRDGVGYVVLRVPNTFTVEAKEAFHAALTNPLKTVDGTVGSHNRQELHDLLDEWINNNLEKNNG